MSETISKRFYKRMQQAMAGDGHWSPPQLLVAYAILHMVDNPNPRWKICRAASEALDSNEAIDASRRSVLAGKRAGKSTFNLARDAWNLYIAYEQTSDEAAGRCLSIELLNPAEINDCGLILDAKILQELCPLPQKASSFSLNLTEVFSD